MGRGAGGRRRVDGVSECACKPPGTAQGGAAAPPPPPSPRCRCLRLQASVGPTAWWRACVLCSRMLHRCRNCCCLPACVPACVRASCNCWCGRHACCPAARTCEAGICFAVCKRSACATSPARTLSGELHSALGPARPLELAMQSSVRRRRQQCGRTPRRVLTAPCAHLRRSGWMAAAGVQAPPASHRGPPAARQQRQACQQRAGSTAPDSFLSTLRMPQRTALQQGAGQRRPGEGGREGQTWVRAFAGWGPAQKGRVSRAELTPPLH